MSVNKRPMIRIAYWLTLMTAMILPAQATVPSGTLPPQCANLIDSDLVLGCYLNDSSNAQIASSIEWVFPSLSDPNFQTLSWPQWPATSQAELVQIFHNVVAWYKGGMVNYPGTLVPDPPPSPAEAAYIDGTIPFPTLDYKTAWQIYLQYVAVNLAAEIYQWVPWGLHNYDVNGLYKLMGPISFFSDCNSESTNNFCPLPYSTPGNAIDAFKFLKTNNLIGATTLDTIGNVLEWSRSNLEHFNGLWSPQNFYYNWQHWGYPPVSRIIAGTVDTDPQGPGPNSPPEHWTAGCLGTSSFLVNLLKAVNIPVEAVQVGGHSAPHFISDDLYLSHGDDPYNALSKAGYPASYLLISRDDYEAWFGGMDINHDNNNVGRRPVDLAVWYPTSNWVLYRYCDDLQANRDHTSGRVFNETFSPIYTVSYLEIVGLWDRLEQARLTLGCPSQSE